MKIIFINFFLVSVFFNLQSHGIENKKEWNIGVLNDNCPFVCIKNNKHVGLYIDIITEIAKKENKQVHFISSPWKRQFVEGENGNIDIIMGAGHRPERDALFYFSKPIFNVPSVMMILKKNLNKYKFKSLNDIKNYNAPLKIGYTRGSSFSSLFSNLIKEKEFLSKLEESNNDVLVIKKLAIGRVDAGFFPDYFSAKDIILKEKISEKIVVYPLQLEDSIEDAYSYFLLSKKTFNENDVKNFNKSNSFIISKNIYDLTMKKYLTKEEINMLKIKN